MSNFERIEITPLTQEDAEAIARWRYDPPYDFYDADADHRDPAELVDARRRGDKYFGAHDENGRLIGYFGLVALDRIVGVGIGLRPDLTGRGLGQAFLEAGLEFARERFSPRLFRLSVAAFNERAIAVYERAGFVATRTYDRETNGAVFSFVEMERRA